MDTRKIYVSGGSTYVMSLPKKWVQKAHLKAGDSLVVTQQNTSLLIETGIKEKDPSVKEIRISQVMSGDAMERMLIAFYLVGYDTIKITLDKKDNLSYKESVRKLIDYLMGVEIVEDTEEVMILEIMVDYRRMKTIQVLQRMFSIERSMLLDVSKALHTMDIELAKDAIVREKEIDRLYFLVVRQLKYAMRYQQVAEELGIKNQRDCLGYRIVVKVFERIADHIENMARSYIQLLDIQEKPAFDEFVELINIIAMTFENSVQVLFERDSRKCEIVFQEVKDVEITFQDISNKLFMTGNIQSTILLKTMIDSLARIASYSEDIAETAINMSVDVP